MEAVTLAVMQQEKSQAQRIAVRTATNGITSIEQQKTPSDCSPTGSKFTKYDFNSHKY